MVRTENLLLKAARTLQYALPLNTIPMELRWTQAQMASDSRAFQHWCVAALYAKVAFWVHIHIHTRIHIPLHMHMYAKAALWVPLAPPTLLAQ